MDQGLLDQILSGYAAMAVAIRAAFQAIIDLFTVHQESYDHRHLMRRKIRRMARR